MSRWGKNIVVPLDSLCKEKENTNRPTVARSVGTVGKWGKMGFTSTRTYALSALPAAVAAAAAAAAAASPGQSPASALDDEMSPSVPEPPKPKKFFKSRNSAPPEMIAQIIQHLPRTPTSPLGGEHAVGNSSGMVVPGREPIKMKIPKSNSVDRKKKSPKKVSKMNKSAISTSDVCEEDIEPTKTIVSEPKAKKKKEEKKLKPEAPPSRVTSRTRKAVNYCEDDEDDRIPTPVKDIIFPKNKMSAKTEEEETQVISSPTQGAVPSVEPEPVLPPPAAPIAGTTTTAAVGPISSTASKTPEHPPIVLRISKGTSRLVSTDSEEHPNTSSPIHESISDHTSKPRNISTTSEEAPTSAAAATTPKIIVKPPKPPSPVPLGLAPPLLNENNEINYCTVKISPDKPPKERLKLIIKTGFRAAAEAKLMSVVSSAENSTTCERPEKEKKQKNKKHKHPKHVAVEQLVTPAATGNAIVGEFKTPSPHLALGSQIEQSQQQQQQSLIRTIVSPPALSERDFDSQSSVLGSISSKGNSTPSQPPLAQTVHDESCVIHSRGSSVITSDLETSQHSSLVAPPSDIESRLESMMMDGEASVQRSSNLVEEPLQEDILAVLRGDESQTGDGTVKGGLEGIKLNGTVEKDKQNVLNDATAGEESTKRRVTRGRSRGNLKASSVDEQEQKQVQSQNQNQETTPPRTALKTRGRKSATALDSPVSQITDENLTPPTLQKRTTRRGTKRSCGEDVSSSLPQPQAESMQLDDAAPRSTEKLSLSLSPTKAAAPAEQNTSAAAAPLVARRGRPPRNVAVNNNNNVSSNNNNNNINKIAASLSAKAGAAEEAKANAAQQSNSCGALHAQQPAASQTQQRSYGRKRKNQQVTQVLQPSAEELEVAQEPTPAKIANMDSDAVTATTTTTGTSTIAATSVLAHSPSPGHGQTLCLTPTLDLHDANSNSTRPPSTSPSSPPLQRHDYKVKDKFKRTLTLDNQVNYNAVDASAGATAQNACDLAGSTSGPEEEQQRGSVKLVISKKKGSIFKSRALVPSDQSEQSTAAKRHLYKHRWDAEANGGAADDVTKGTKEAAQANAAARTAADAVFDDFSEDLSPPSTLNNVRDNSSPVMGKFARVVKPNPQTVPSAESIFEMPSNTYTRVRNVKTAHQIQEIGEYQEMDDDVEYILDALQPHNPTSTRCLSALQLATKCLTPTFRMHVRAHGVVTKFFKALSDANTDLSLGLCTSAIMYILSQEGLNMDLDRDSLELMINLLEADDVAAPSDRATYERNRQKVRELCESIKAQGKAAHLNVDSITVGTLAMETLLSLTSKRAGEWFKEELRQLGGLEHIIKTISDCCRPVLKCDSAAGSGAIKWTQSLLDNMQTVARCMRVLENVTQMNEANQKYVLSYAKGTAVSTLCTLYRLCDRELMCHPTNELSSKEEPGSVVRELLIPLMKVLINLTHTFSPSNGLGAELLGQQPDVIDISFHLLLQASNYIPDRCVFELNIFVLLFLTNLSMHTIPNRVLIMKALAPAEVGSVRSNKTAVQAVMEYFYKCEELARLVEKNTDAILDNTDKNKKKQEEVDETVNNLLQKAGHHMEHTLKGSYAAILIGHLIADSEEYEMVVRSHLHGNGFKEIISVLEKYYTFMNLTASSEAATVAHIKSTKKLIDYFKKRDLLFDSNEKVNSCGLPVNLEMHLSNATASCSGSKATNSTAEEQQGSTASTTATMATTRSTTAQRVYKTYSQR